MHRRSLLLALPLLALPALAAPALAEPVTIETARGPVALERPERVVVFDIAALDTMDALGIVPVGVPDTLYFPNLAPLEDQAESVGTLFEPNFETVAALEPDLIVIGGRSAAQYDALAAIAPTIDMTIGGGALTDDARARLLAYGSLFGKEAAAEELAQGYDAALADARAAVKDKGTGVVLLTNGPKISAFGPGSRFGWVHDELGLPAAATTTYEGSHGESVSFEFLQKANPDWMVVVDRAAAVGQSADSARQTLDNPLVHETTAWKEDHLVFLDPASMYIANGGIRSLTGLLRQITDAFDG
jgi:iron complex transport system substrate-binding protein